VLNPSNCKWLVRIASAMAFTRINNFLRMSFRASMRKEAPTPLIGIVDDDEAVRDSMSSLMRSEGYLTAVFASGDAFLDSEHLHNKNRTILLLDIQMPGMSGLDLHRRLSDFNCSIPVIFITAHGEEGVRERALQQGAFAVFVKPFSDQGILHAIRSALEASNDKH
jgi:FixJ family two-component response regulator